MSRAADSQPFPFVFLKHGLFSYGDEIEQAHWYIVFEREVPPDERGAALAGAPPPFAGRSVWAGPIIYQESPADRYFDAHVWKAYGEGADQRATEELSEEELEEEDQHEVTEHEAQAFSDALDAWLRRVHERWPISFVIAWSGDVEDPWSEWSAAQVAPRVIPRVRAIQSSLRPPTAGNVWRDTPEQLLGWSLVRAIGSYLDAREPETATETRSIEEALGAARGYDPYLDSQIERLLRMLRPKSAAR